MCWASELFCAVLQIVTQYARYVAVLKWLTLALFAYFGTVMVVQIPWAEAAAGFLLPTFSGELAFWTTVVAILGTTISPYLFFWQASQEAEDTKEEPQREPLVQAPRQGPDAIERIRADTYVGMAFSNLVALAIMVTTAATLHVAGVHNVESSAQAAEALKPVAGEAAFVDLCPGRDRNRSVGRAGAGRLGRLCRRRGTPMAGRLGATAACGRKLSTRRSGSPSCSASR